MAVNIIILKPFTQSHPHPTVAVLAWLIATNRIERNDQAMAGDLIESPDFQKLPAEIRQWIWMINGANLSEEGREMALQFLKDQMPVEAINDSGDLSKPPG